MISCNNTMSVDGFNDSFYSAIGGSNSVDSDGNCGSVDNDVDGGRVDDGDCDGNGSDDMKGERRR